MRQRSGLLVRFTNVFLVVPLTESRCELAGCFWLGQSKIFWSEKEVTYLENIGIRTIFC